jgi:hypothetical protein
VQKPDLNSRGRVLDNVAAAPEKENIGHAAKLDSRGYGSCGLNYGYFAAGAAAGQK